MPMSEIKPFINVFNCRYIQSLNQVTTLRELLHCFYGFWSLFCPNPWAYITTQSPVVQQLGR